jgi:hypothetical protein
MTEAIHDLASIELLTLMIAGGLYVEDRRVDPVRALDLKDQGFICITAHQGKLSLTDKGREIAEQARVRRTT